MVVIRAPVVSSVAVVVCLADILRTESDVVGEPEVESGMNLQLKPDEAAPTQIGTTTIGNINLLTSDLE